MNNNLVKIWIWFAFLGINLIIFAIAEQWFSTDEQRFVVFKQGIWICTALNSLYLILFTGPWAHRTTRILKGAPFFPLLHLLLNLFGILVFYKIGGLQNRHTGLGFVAVILVHLVFVKWALLSILRPLSEKVKSSTR